MKTVVVTGVSGYIGGHIALQLHDTGHRVIGIDRRPLPNHLKEFVQTFVQADFDSDEAYRTLISTRPNAIVHCAGTSLVGPSIANPSDYYNNNVVKTFHLLGIVTSSLPNTRVIFSSSAAVYGTPIISPCHEVDPCEPISPYGESKRMIEQMLESYHRAYNLDYVAFRYFNAAGADSQTRHGQEPGATHIVARVLESVRDNAEFTLYGIEYPTADGTCIRDYVHVEDIARAHVLALDTKLPAGVYNLGSNVGTSNRQIISSATKITGKSVNVKVGTPREGDPALLTASSEKFDSVYPNWKKFGLDDIVSHAWKWYVR